LHSVVGLGHERCSPAEHGGDGLAAAAFPVVPLRMSAWLTRSPDRVHPSSRPGMPIGPIPYRTVTRQGDSLSHSQILKHDLLHMFEESALSDVEVVCTVGGSRKSFRAHRLILAARSPVFKAMFLTGMRENRAGRVVIEDSSPEAVKCMLDFAYKDECESLDEANIIDVLKIANKYDMPGLRDIGLEFMAQNSRSDNVVAFLTACDTYNLLDFKHLLLSALVDNPAAMHECIHSDSLDCNPELLKELLTLCAHRMSRWTKASDRHSGSAKNFDGLPYRSQCYICVREVGVMSKQMLGEMLFPMVQKIRPEHANKITGMIIELDNLELVPLFESESALREKVEEAVAVLWAAEEPAAAATQQLPSPSLSVATPLPAAEMPTPFSLGEASSSPTAGGTSLTAAQVLAHSDFMLRDGEDIHV